MNFHTKSGICSSKNRWVMSTDVLFFFCNLFEISIPTSMQNLESVAQKMSELCSIECAMPVTNLHVAVLVSDNSGSFLNWLIPDRFISFTRRYLRPLQRPSKMVRPSKYSFRINLRRFPTSWDNIGRHYCCRNHLDFFAFQSEWHMPKLLQQYSYWFIQ